MGDFIMEFLDWLSEVWNSAIDTAYEISKIAMSILIVMLSMPFWILPFLFWLVFVKLKGGDSDG